MLKRFKNHCNNPITWGAYYKFCGIKFVISTIVSVATFLKIYFDQKSLNESLAEFGGYKHINEEES